MDEKAAVSALAETAPKSTEDNTAEKAAQARKDRKEALTWTDSGTAPDTIVKKDRRVGKVRKVTISRLVIRHLLLAVLGVFLFSLVLIYQVFTWRAEHSAIVEMREALLSDAAVMAIVRGRLTLTSGPAAKKISLSAKPTSEELNLAEQILNQSKVVKDLEAVGEADEVSLADSRGQILVSTVPELTGFNLNATRGSRAVFSGLRETGDYVHDTYIPAFSDRALSLLYFGTATKDGFYVLYGITQETYARYMYATLKNSLDEATIGMTGTTFACARDKTVIASSGGRYNGSVYDETAFPFDINTVEPMRCFRSVVEGEESYVMVGWNEEGDYCAVATYPLKEALADRNATVLTTIVMQVLILIALIILLTAVLNSTIVRGIKQVAGSLSRITDGNLDEQVNVRSAEEFESLSDDINATVDALKRLIAEAAARIDAELAYAKEIQLSALPRVFPPFPERTEFDLFARMDTAKEVGGDFYDFYLLSGDRLAFLIADVSGKGIPAALFMMQSKTMIKNLAEENHPVDEIFALANRRLCESNDAGMFVTAWMCILNYKTGEAEFANAGHNFPVLRHKDGSFEFLKSRPGFVLAGMARTKFRKNALTFAPGDEIFLYTDGVTEATDAREELYGEPRLLTALNTASYGDAEDLCAVVKADVDRFVGDAPQFDDITMVCLRYLPSGGGEQAQDNSGDGKREENSWAE